MLLNEAKVSIRHGTYIAYIRQGNSVPYIFLSGDNALPESNDIYFITVSTRKFNALYNKIEKAYWGERGYGDGRHERIHGFTDADLKIIKENIFGPMYNLQILNEPTAAKKFVRDVEFYDTLFKDAIQIQRFKSPEDFVKYAANNTKLKIIDTYAIRVIFGIELKDAVHDETDTIKVGNSEIVFPPEMRESRRKNIIDLIKMSDEILAKRGFAFLTDIKMFVKPLPKNYAGLYYLADGLVYIDSNAKKTTDSIHTIIHELGHKYYYEFMTQDERNSITEKYKELVGLRPNDKQKAIKQKIDDLKTNIRNKGTLTADGSNFLDTLNIGDVYHYTGKKTKALQQIRSLAPYKITGIDPATGDFRMSSIELPSIGYTMKPVNYSFFLSSFKKEGEESNASAVKKTTIITDGWFPSAYSATNEREWFAECFAYYILGMITYQPLKEYYDQYLRR